MKVCTIEGCGKPCRARGLCGGHYTAYRRTGAMTPVTRQHETIGELAELGCTVYDIARRLRIKPESVQRTLERAGDYDLRARLAVSA